MSEDLACEFAEPTLQTTDGCRLRYGATTDKHEENAKKKPRLENLGYPVNEPIQRLILFLNSLFRKCFEIFLD